MGYFLLIIYVFFLHKATQFYVQSLTDYVLHFFVGMLATIVPVGYLLSVFSLLSQPAAWGGTLVLLASSVFLIAKYTSTVHRSFSLKEGIIASYYYLKREILLITTTEKIIFIALSVGLLVVSVLNLYTLVSAYPNEWDSMTGHLVKCAYYLQHGNMNRLEGTTWTVDYYPNSLPTLQLFFYHLFGEKGFKVIHYLSYWIVVLTLYKVTFYITNKTKESVFVAFMGALLPTALIQASMTETDIVFSAYLGLVVYFLLRFFNFPNRSNAVLTALMTCIWMSHKVTFLLVVPSVLCLLVVVVWQTMPFFKAKNNFLILVATFFLALAIYVVPNGYLANLREAKGFKIGALSAPEEVMNWHGIENYSSKDKITNFKLNILRYTSDFLHLDGIRSHTKGNELDTIFRKPLDAFFQKFSLDRNSFWVVAPFVFQHSEQRPTFYKERPSWGLIGICFVFPALLSVFFKRNSNTKNTKLRYMFLLCGVLHFLSLCYSAPYDPIKARYFMNMAIWFFPLIAFFYEKSWKPYVAIAAFGIIFSGISTLLFRDLVPLLGTKNISNLSRVEQLLQSRPTLAVAYQRFEELVPIDAVVALGTQQEHEDYEYPLWGEQFQRKLIPLHPFRAAVKAIPAEAQYLFYSEGIFPYKEGDIKLNNKNLKETAVEESVFYLRKLK